MMENRSVVHAGKIIRASHKAHKMRKHKTAKVRKSRKMNLDDIPDVIIRRILHFHVLSPDNHTHRIRLVNRKLAAMALPILIHTINIDTPEFLVRLVRLPLSPLYYKPWIAHVRCVEFSFIPDLYVLEASITSRRLILPGIITIRFRYSQGIPIKESASDESFQASLSQYSLQRASNLRSNASWLKFLSRLRPQRFEWITNDPSHLRLVPIPLQYQQLFELWSPTTVLFDGICPVYQSELLAWGPLFLGKRVRIRGRFHTSHFYFLSGFLHSVPGCEVLILEKQATGSADGKITPTLIFGTMLLQLVGWTKEDRDFLKLVLTGKAPARPLLPSKEEKTRGKSKKAPMTAHQESGYFLRLVTFLGILVQIILFGAFKHRIAPLPNHGHQD